jgi:hypothetical protein
VIKREVAEEKGKGNGRGRGILEDKMGVEDDKQA